VQTPLLLKEEEAPIEKADLRGNGNKEWANFGSELGSSAVD